MTPPTVSVPLLVVIVRLPLIVTAPVANMYAAAGSVAEQSISSMRTVASFRGEDKEAEKYREKLVEAEKVGIQSGAAIAKGIASVLFILFASYGLGMWFGAKEIVDAGNAGTATPDMAGNILVVFWR